MSAVAAPPGRGPIPGGPPGPPPPAKPSEPPSTRKSSSEHGGSAPSDFGGKPPNPKDFDLNGDGNMSKEESSAFTAATKDHTASEKNKADIEKSHIKAEADMYKAQVKSESEMHKTDKTAEVEHHRINNDNKMSKTFGK